MIRQIKNFFVKSTPVFIVSIIGSLLSTINIIYLWFDDSNHGGLATGLLAILLLLFVVAFVVDRYLLEKLKYRTVLIIEFISIPLLVVGQIYRSREFSIQVETKNPYIIAVYAEDGISIKDLSRHGMFDKRLVVYSDTPLRINYRLLNESRFEGVWIPSSWRSSHRIYFDTSISGRKIRIEFNSCNLTHYASDSIINEVKRNLK